MGSQVLLRAGQGSGCDGSIVDELLVLVVHHKGIVIVAKKILGIEIELFIGGMV